MEQGLSALRAEKQGESICGKEYGLDNVLNKWRCPLGRAGTFPALPIHKLYYLSIMGKLMYVKVSK